MICIVVDSFLIIFRCIFLRNYLTGSLRDVDLEVIEAFLGPKNTFFRKVWAGLGDGLEAFLQYFGEVSG